ncbi:endo alpha-1,4 polygalactosaminidase [Amycolatopsis samaneae]|uniref:Endo alpha-1,4 polygalactosaminidase n=1 Tax=Amycolatopsis samaneae TaxID=664691 RepID=A0ABW5GXC1_9PSEU
MPDTVTSTAEAGPGTETASVAPPPVGAGFDYQIGGPYPPPPGVRVVARDHSVAPAAGLYNICYVNAFQAQPGAQGGWDPDLLLRDVGGEVIMDGNWDEALLDLRTEDKRQRIAAKVNGWVDQCAAKGFQAVEPDNYDSYTRSRDLMNADQAQAYVRLLSSHAHRKGLAIAQKNTSELSDRRRQNGLDFAIAEECGEQNSCDGFTSAFGRNVLVIEYGRAGLENACNRWGVLSVVRRDRAVSPKTAGGDRYVRETC